eukprot:6327619-Prymnesium_polylepis.1
MASTVSGSWTLDWASASDNSVTATSVKAGERSPLRARTVLDWSASTVSGSFATARSTASSRCGGGGSIAAWRA